MELFYFLVMIDISFWLFKLSSQQVLGNKDKNNNFEG